MRIDFKREYSRDSFQVGEIMSSLRKGYPCPMCIIVLSSAKIRSPLTRHPVMCVIMNLCCWSSFKSWLDGVHTHSRSSAWWMRCTCLRTALISLGAMVPPTLCFLQCTGTPPGLFPTPFLHMNEGSRVRSDVEQAKLGTQGTLRIRSVVLSQSSYYVGSSSVLWSATWSPQVGNIP